MLTMVQTTILPISISPSLSADTQGRSRLAVLDTVGEALSEPGARLAAVVDTPYEVRPLDELTWPAFAALVEANNGIFGGCWCIGFHPEGTAGSATANRDRKLERVRAGTTQAALVFAGDACVGWCQFGAPEELQRIKNRVAYEK